MVVCSPMGSAPFVLVAVSDSLLTLVNGAGGVDGCSSRMTTDFEAGVLLVSAVWSRGTRTLVSG